MGERINVGHRARWQDGGSWGSYGRILRNSASHGCGPLRQETPACQRCLVLSARDGINCSIIDLPQITQFSDTNQTHVRNVVGFFVIHAINRTSVR